MATGLGGLEGIEGFFRQVYVISPFFIFLLVVLRGDYRKEKNFGDFLEFSGNNPSIPPTPSEWGCDLC